MTLNFSAVFTFILVLASVSPIVAQEEFNILILRQAKDGNLLTGVISVNEKEIGRTYENNELKISAGEYSGKLRYFSKSNHAVGPFGTLGYEGDFLLEIGNVKWSDGKIRTDLLFHGGNKDTLSKGCIMLGAVSKDAHGVRHLPSNHTLVKLRKLFYGTETPISTPNKTINIKIVDPK